MICFLLRLSLLCLAILFSDIDFVNASVSFGSRDSRINVFSGARLNVRGSNFYVDGTISQELGGLITGQRFSFVNGVLEQDGAEAILNGTFDPNAAEVLQFAGDGVLKGEPGNVFYGVLISGLNNVISGQPTFVLPIRLLNYSSEALIDMQNALSQNIDMNGGVIRLINDLSLGDDVQIVGPGRIDLNNRQLIFGGFYTSPWSESLGFEHATSLVLTGSVKLDGYWFFYGDCNLIGNGTILDLSDGGKIVVGPNTNLYIEDLVIKGLGNSAGQIIFASETSNLYMSKVDTCLSAAYTTTIGNIIVEGASSFVLGEFDWNINSIATLTVDGATLWLDTLSKGLTALAGHLNSSRAVYDINGYNVANVAANIADGTLTYLNDGIISLSVTSTTGGGGFIDPAAAILLSGNVHVDVTMNYFIDVPSDKSINITGDMTLDGGGSTINFPNSGIPQFIVQPGVIVNLTNITISNINQNTFLIYPGGQINIGENVTWSFAEDVTFSSPLINVLPGVNFTWIGLDGVRYITLFNSTNPNMVILNINDGTLTLENIVLDGISHIKNNSNSLIHLSGESGVDIDVDTNLNFKASGAENNITLLVNALTLSGLIVFGDKSINELHIAFALIDGLGLEKYPRINLSGGPGIIVGGPNNGASRLIFDDRYVILDLQDLNSIQLDINAHLIYEELDILTNPILQLSTRVLDDGTQINGLQIDASNARFSLSKKSKIDAAGKKDILRQIAYEQDAQINLDELGQKIRCCQALNDAYSDAFFTTIPKDPKKHRLELLRYERFNSLNENNQMTKGVIKSFRHRIVEPNVYGHQYAGQYVNSTDVYSGSTELRRGSNLNNLIVDSALPFSVYLKEGSQIIQGLQNVSFDPSNHSVNVIGRGNIINVQRQMSFDGNLFLDQNSSLEFKFMPTGSEAVVIFEPGTVLTIPENSTLIFSGSGKVILSDGVVIKLLATEDTQNKIIINQSNFILSDGATLDFASGANSRIDGIGNIIIQNTASIKPSVPSSLTIGLSERDNITIKVSGNSQICLENPYIDGYTTISMQKLTTALNFEGGGSLIVGANGVFEINALNGQLSRGFVSDLSFRNNGTLTIKDNGRFVVAQNRMLSTFNQIYDFSWGGFCANISGGGFVEYIDVNPTKCFLGKVFGLESDLFTDVEHMTFDKLALLLARKTPPILKTSTLLESLDGIGAVITKDKIKVDLLAGDTVISDDYSGTIYGKNANEKAFTITAEGKRN
ncbi:MAG: hypothetical protein US49_C0006G0083 [candidate division TM6 bacterium GW2011_GWF2_37_49]|nr:MAG: hypothetical protein US49_C0006G0083 [candidate division TM6 bacterium GW2011_GWF2_37_49]